MPAANPEIFTATAICAVLVMVPAPGDTASQVALSVAVQLVGRLFPLDTLIVWLGGLLAPWTAWKVMAGGLTVTAQASGGVQMPIASARPMPHQNRSDRGHFSPCRSLTSWWA